jgi:hypothetical protein
MTVNPVNRVVDKKRIIRKMEGQVGGEAQGVDDPKKNYVFHDDMPKLNLFRNYIFVHVF